MLDNVLCEVVLVFTGMFYYADYYRIIIIAYDYESSERHASFHVYSPKIYIYVWGVSLVTLAPSPPPPPQHTLTNEPMKKIYESQREKKWRKWKISGEIFLIFLKKGKKKKEELNS